MPDPDKALGQAVKQEPADELHSRYRERFRSIFFSILIGEGHHPFLKRPDAAVGIEFLVPGVQCGDKAQFSAEGIVTEGQQRLGSRFIQDREHHFLVVEHNGVERMRQGKDDMKIAGG